MSFSVGRRAVIDGLLLLFPLFFLFHGLSAFGLLNNVEGMYAEIAREMLHGGHWVIPYLNDVPYIEKPPLLYWLTALSMSIFGVHDWAVRLVPAFSGAFLLAIVGWFGWRLKGRRYAVSSVFILGTSFGFLVMSSVALTDALLSELFNAALLLTYIGLVQRQKFALRAAAICLAFAVLAKGFVALVLFGLTGLSYLACCHRRDWPSVLKQSCDPWAIALSLLLCLPWHLAAAVALPEFSWFYFVNEHLYRFLGIREPHDYYSGTVFYYLPRLALMFLPWLLPFALFFFSKKRNRENDRDLRRFLWCCVLAPLFFFSVSSAKANYYVALCLPGLALLMALEIEQWIVRSASLRLERALWLVLFITGAALIPIEAYVLRYGHDREASFSARPMASAIQKREAAGQVFPVFLYQDYEDYSALPFYLQSTLGIVDPRTNDLRFGMQLGAGREHFLSVDDFMGRHQPAWLLVLDTRQRDLARTALPSVLRPVEKIGKATLYRFDGDIP